MFADVLGCVGFHVGLHLFFCFVKTLKGAGVHPCIIRCLVVDVGAVEHEVGVGMVLVVYDVLLGHEGEQVFECCLGQSWVIVDFCCVLCPLCSEELVQVKENVVVHRELMVLEPCL